MRPDEERPTEFIRKVAPGEVGVRLGPVVALAEAVERYIQTMETPLKVAVMGCPVNGPGEAKQADIGVAGQRPADVGAEVAIAAQDQNRVQLFAFHLADVAHRPLGGRGGHGGVGAQ